MKMAVIYHSASGHTKEMAKVIAEGMQAAGGDAKSFSRYRRRPGQKEQMRRNRHSHHLASLSGKINVARDFLYETRSRR